MSKYSITIDIDDDTHQKIADCLAALGDDCTVVEFLQETLDGLVEDMVDPQMGYFEDFAEGDEQLEARLLDILLTPVSPA